MRVGLLTSGGDCQALNPTMRGVVLTLKNLAKKVEIIGFANGYKGLIYNHYSIVSSSAFVNEQIGVDNVCERSACAASGGGRRLVGKTADNGITVAVYKMV